MASVLTFGEIMMRLATPGFSRLIQATNLEVTYAGGEANVAVALAALGHHAYFTSVLPQNALADAAEASLRYYGVDTSRLIHVPGGRLGVYFLETGASQRASRVIYDRGNSAIAQASPALYDWPKLMEGCEAFHTTGITPALGAPCALAVSAAIATAKAKGLFTSFDLNYRSKLWSRDLARQTVGPLLRGLDLVVGNEEDAHDVLGISAEATDVHAGKIDRHKYESVARQILEQYGPRRVAITLRESESASVNHWSACLFDGHDFLLSKRYTIHVVDRVGAGDAFCGALLAGLLESMPKQEALDFAVAASCLKHSIPGDFNKVTRDEILQLCRGQGSGRVVR